MPVASDWIHCSLLARLRIEVLDGNAEADQCADVGEVVGGLGGFVGQHELQVWKLNAQPVAINLGVNVNDEDFGHERIIPHREAAAKRPLKEVDRGALAFILRGSPCGLAPQDEVVRLRYFAALLYAMSARSGSPSLT